MENKREKEIGNFENYSEKAEREFFPKEKFERREEPEVKIKTIDEIKDNDFSADKKEDKVKETSEEEKKIDYHVKESQGASIGKIAKIINIVKKKFTPFGVDSYHDKMTRKKDGE